MTNATNRRYVLITPAKDEEKTVAETISSVAAQTVLPTEWIIVSDGSVDATDKIVRQAMELHPWIRLVCLPPRKERDFAAVVKATQIGLGTLSQDDYDYIGLLDADVRFPADYFARVISHFEGDRELGLAGGMVVDLGLPKDQLPRNKQDVPGAVQFFRRECFDQLGGLVAIPQGGWDAVTCVRARMAGYRTRLLTDLIVDHLKPRNIAAGGLLKRYYQLGTRDYFLGYHPLFEIIKCFSRLLEKPLVLASMCRLIGFIYANFSQQPRILSKQIIAYTRREQLRRLNLD